MKLHHVGYYVTDIEQACRDFGRLGYRTETSPIFDEARKVIIQFLCQDVSVENANPFTGGRCTELN